MLAWHLAWTNPAREGCGIAVGDWLYGARSPVGADAAPVGTLAAAWGLPGRDHELTILHREGKTLTCTTTSPLG